MKGYVIQKLDNGETRYYEIIGEDKESPIIGESPVYTARVLNPVEKVVFDITKEAKK